MTKEFGVYNTAARQWVMDSAKLTAVGLGTRNPPCKQYRVGPVEAHFRYFVYKLGEIIGPVRLKPQALAMATSSAR